MLNLELSGDISGPKLRVFAVRALTNVSFYKDARDLRISQAVRTVALPSIHQGSRMVVPALTLVAKASTATGGA